MPIGEGDQAPGFTLRDRDDRPVSLADLRGRPVVLMFFPGAFSATCTDQFRGLAARGLPDGARVVGVSVDSRYSLGAFADAIGLDGVTLLADFHPKGAVARAYGVWLPDWGYSTRATFVIDSGGVVRGAEVVIPPELPDEAAVAAALAVCTTP